MNEFVQSRKQFLHQTGNHLIAHIVIGNESCDLDSAISAIVYAYLLQISEYASRTDVLVLPVLNTERDKLRLKNEVIFWLQETLHLDLDAIICKDELNLSAFQQNDNQIWLTLVDHNENAEYESKGKLIEIIDHHTPTRQRNDVQTEIDPQVGSCCSLIARRYLNYCEANQMRVNEQIVLLLYGPIVLESAQRFNQIDIDMVNIIERYLEPLQIERKIMYQQLIKAKNSIESFTLKDLIEKDLKFVPFSDGKRIAVASFSGVLARDVMSKSKFKNELWPVQNQSNYAAIVMMGIDNTQENKIERDLAIFSTNQLILKKIAKRLSDENSLQLKLNQIAKDEENLLIFDQHNERASRKVVLPYLMELTSDQQFISLLAEGTKQLPNDKNMFNGVIKASEPVNAINNRKLVNDNKGKSMVNGGSPIKHGAGESINYYESYFEDSFVGEFSGAVNEEKLSPENIRQLGWADDEKINNTLEFGFDSFGPESILFQSACDHNNPGDEHAGKSVDSPEQKIHEQQKRQESQKDQTSTEQNETKMTPTLNDQMPDYELVSLSVAEPQLKSKLDACFDQEKIMQSYDISSNQIPPPSIIYNNHVEINDEPINGDTNHESIHNQINNVDNDVHDKDAITNVNTNVDNQTVNDDDEIQTNIDNEQENSDANNLGQFKRNTTLTQSQRRQISPSFKFEEILNTSDDVLLQDSNVIAQDASDDQTQLNLTEGTADRQFEDGVNDKTLERSDLTPSFIPEGTISRTGTLKKKIVANLKDINFEAELSTEVEKKIQKHIHFSTPNEILVQPEVSCLEPTDDDYPDWRSSCPIGINGEVKQIDMKVIEPYKKVLSHAGYCQNSNFCVQQYDDQSPAIITFSACYLPDRSRKDYEYVMENLFMYVLTTLHELIADDYILIYFHNSTNSNTNGNNMPTFNWLKRCYQMIDRKLRKNLKALYLVHPTFWLKTLVIMTKPFINTKFSRKLKFINSLQELNSYVKIDLAVIPDCVKLTDMAYDKKSSRKSNKTFGLLN